MRFVLDTSAVIHLVERRPDALLSALRSATEAPSINVVTLGELAVGWTSLPTASLRRRTYHAARRMRVVGIAADQMNSEPTGLVASFGVGRAAGIKGNDAWIAATAHFSAAILLTYDESLATRFASIGESRLIRRPDAERGS